MSLKSKTITDSIYEIIESDIIAGVYKPGQRLMEAEIAQKLQVSRTPVRDVMIRLEQKGLVTIKAHRGVYVRKMTREDIRDCYQLRAVLEGLGAKLATINASEEERARLKEMLAKMHEILQAQQGSTTFKEMAMINDEFHKLIFKIAGNKVLAQTQAQLSGSIALIRSTSWLNSSRVEKVWLEHKDIVDAICAKDEELAQKKAEEHIYYSWKSAEGNLDRIYYDFENTE